MYPDAEVTSRPSDGGGGEGTLDVRHVSDYYTPGAYEKALCIGLYQDVHYTIIT